MARKSKSTGQIRHEQLIDFLSQFSQYQYEGKPVIKKVKEEILHEDVKFLDTNCINKGVVVFADFLNLYSGSSGNIDLYRLLQAYLTIPECRDQINRIVDEAHSAQIRRSRLLVKENE